MSAFGNSRTRLVEPIVAWAGAGLVKTLSELNLVDEYRLIVNPVLLGSGTRLFEGVPNRKLKLVRTMQVGDELAVLCHEPVHSGVICGWRSDRCGSDFSMATSRSGRRSIGIADNSRETRGTQKI